mmetsp:Transcript_13842/g.19216  ORF Transcript_13842/g.19216 Transcript_13842/m.19216 type:complete len:91 (-) Transcript_13842:33-305(-)
MLPLATAQPKELRDGDGMFKSKEFPKLHHDTLLHVPFSFSQNQFGRLFCCWPKEVLPGSCKTCNILSALRSGSNTWNAPQACISKFSTCE